MSPYWANAFLLCIMRDLIDEKGKILNKDKENAVLF